MQNFRRELEEARRQTIRQEQTREQDARNAQSQDDGFASQAECIICMSRSRNASFPCGHVCACYLCALQCSECPVCRKRGVPLKLFMT